MTNIDVKKLTSCNSDWEMNQYTLLSRVKEWESHFRKIRLYPYINDSIELHYKLADILQENLESKWWLEREAMITIIAGSRSCIEYTDVLQAIYHCPWRVTKVISGGARGADALGEKWAYRNNVPYVIVYAEWEKYGKSAGYKRNEIMADMAKTLIALWDGESKGTKHMIDIAERKALDVFVWRTSEVIPKKEYIQPVGL